MGSGSLPDVWSFGEMRREMQVTSAVRKQEGHRTAPDRALGEALLVPAPEMLLRFLSD